MLVFYVCLLSVIAAQPVEQVDTQKSVPEASPRETERASVSTPGVDLTQQQRDQILPIMARWLGVTVRSEQIVEARSVVTTDGRWAFSSLVTKDDPAYCIRVREVVFSFEGGRKTVPFDLYMLVRARDSGLLGVRSKWVHEGQGVRVAPRPEAEFRQALAGQSECWGGLGATCRSNLREVLSYICDHFGGPLSADYLCAYTVSPHQVCPGGASMCVRPELGPVWSVELASLAGATAGQSLAFGMDRPDNRGRKARLIVSHMRHVVIDSPLASGCSGNWPRPVVEITTEDGKVELRNWWDDKHPPPFGLVNKAARTVSTKPSSGSTAPTGDEK
jgi:hypothetical protein